MLTKSDVKGMDTSVNVDWFGGKNLVPNRKQLKLTGRVIKGKLGNLYVAAKYKQLYAG